MISKTKESKPICSTKSPIQDEIFIQSEGNRFFRRNFSFLKDASFRKNDPVIRILEKWRLKFSTVAQFGCCSGSLLAMVKERFGGSRFVGIEPSQEAIEFGMKAYPGIEFYRGTIAKHPLQKTCFDLVIVQFVLHWVDRSTLFKSICEIDGFVRDGGFLIIGDFDPNCPTKQRYHHLSQQRVWTYKQNYAQVFISTHLYTELDHYRTTHGDDSHSPNSSLRDNDRAGYWLLRKHLSKLYREGITEK